MTLCIYGVMLYDDLSEFPAPDTYVYLTRDAAQRRADRKTYEYAGVRYWAEVYEIKCGWDTDTLGPFGYDGATWLCFAGYVNDIRYDLYMAKAQNDKLRELVIDIWTSCPVNAEDCSICKHKEGKTVYGCALYDSIKELGIEVK